MRVALLSYRSKPHSGGQGTYVRQLSRGLTQLGHQVEVFSGQPYPELDPGVGLTKVPSLDLYREPDPFRRPRLGEFRNLIDVAEFATMCTAGFPEPWTFSLRVARLLADRRGDFDIIHDNQCLGSGLLDLQRAGWPVVATIHHPITRDRRLDLAEATGWRRLTVRRWYGFLRMQGRVARRLPRILTVSANSAADIATDFGVDPERISTVGLGVDLEQFAPRPQRRPNSIVCIASADMPLKGVPVLLRAVAELATDREVTLTLVTPPGGTAIGQAAELGIGDRVQIRSSLSEAELAELLGTATVACVPSLYEGFSLPAVEAMASGTPLVATRAGAIPEVVGEAAMLVAPGDVTELRLALAKVLDDAQLRESMAAAGRARAAEAYSWLAAARSTAAVYEQVRARQVDDPATGGEVC
ncbi:glycosyltransferase family 4 protein [Naumannella halotolerans]|uniref:Glycosyltransferase involved in cell wall biosynthesis n=1 Tax=Naumannella halotolerans TaxID=993414 RepID=A0A4R7J1I0_9ACTN|nr:glycosyltransferase family 4 protein [Naumannella halotolerans]TDT30924.1 glycosyltransferase involved in cell wall biosynthesis [Naumannella halotolerans]